MRPFRDRRRHELHLRAGTTLDFETQSLLNVTVEVDDVSVGLTPDDAVGQAITITDVNEAPSLALPNTSARWPKTRTPAAASRWPTS